VCIGPMLASDVWSANRSSGTKSSCEHSKPTSSWLDGRKEPFGKPRGFLFYRFLLAMRLYFSNTMNTATKDRITIGISLLAFCISVLSYMNARKSTSLSELSARPVVQLRSAEVVDFKGSDDVTLKLDVHNFGSTQAKNIEISFIPEAVKEWSRLQFLLELAKAPLADTFNTRKVFALAQSHSDFINVRIHPETLRLNDPEAPDASQIVLFGEVSYESEDGYKGYDRWCFSYPIKGTPDKILGRCLNQEDEMLDRMSESVRMRQRKLFMRDGEIVTEPR
jgi:hypothetical protein